MTYSYKGYTIIVTIENNKIHIWLQGLNDHESEVTLEPLWLPDIMKPEKNYFKKYVIGDYYQHTFISSHPRQGMGSIIHEFLIEHRNKLGVPIENVYSTNPLEDETEIYPAAIEFWRKRILLQKAIHNEDLKRYSIIWQL